MERLLDGGEIDGRTVALKEAVGSLRNMSSAAVRATQHAGWTSDERRSLRVTRASG
ncbi:MAG TPA: hypothetical protein VF541_10440 [Longimicrobium sp.]|jgi:hypothetical protein